MSMYLTFTIGKDKRNLVDDITDFHIDKETSTNPQWLQARQNEDGMRQVFVTVKNEDGSPFNLTGCNYWFQGKLPDGIHKIIDAKHGVTLDAQNGKFRFDMPKQAFAVAGSYVQAFFRIVRDGESITTLEFDLTVLADLVYNDLVPSDYITPFEDLYFKLKDYIVKANGDFDAAMAQWKKDVANLITELNADVSGINLTITEIKSQLSALEDKIKADGLLTQAEFDEQIKALMKTVNDALNRLNQPVDVDEVIFGLPVDEQKPENKVALDTMAAQIDTDKFNFVFLTDPHYANQSQWPDISNDYGVDHVNRALYLDQYLDAVVLGGDNIDGWHDSYEGLLADQNQIATEFLFGSPNHADKFALKGNHDDGSARVNDYRNGQRDYLGHIPQVISNERFKKDYHNAELLFGEKRQGNSNYFYKDYPDKKIRLIGLDSNDNPDTILDDDGVPLYLGIWRMGYRQKQLDWLAHVALQNVPKDYTTIICTHVQANMDDQKNEITPTHDSHTNQPIVNQIINDFIQGKASSNLQGTVKDWEVSLSTDFTAQGPRLFAGWIHGHEHTENIRTNNGFNDIGILASVGRGAAQNYIGDTDGWSLISVDTATRTLNLKGFGIATDRKFNY
ncbi:BppU family phage baseplate upper protein [Pediococcus acidilactici]|uniref:BppU family phage baseplate upper protein n=1 Tax=Pediococcus acidilactici TaxID=1254 RepID=UPI0035623996